MRPAYVSYKSVVLCVSMGGCVAVCLHFIFEKLNCRTTVLQETIGRCFEVDLESHRAALLPQLQSFSLEKVCYVEI